MKRAILVVLDSVGVGELQDAKSYGDEGSHTLDHVYKACNGLEIKELEKFYPEKTVIFLSIREFPILLDALSAKRGYYFLKAKSLTYLRFRSLLQEFSIVST